jgi:hypothetical protein
MPLENWIQHSRVDEFLYDWQTVIAGILAFVAGFGTVVATMIIANKQIAASREEAKKVIDAIRASLAVEIREYIGILIKTREILRPYSEPEKPIQARDLRSVAVFSPPTVYPASADRIGLLGPLAVSVTSFYSTIERLNSTVRFLTIDPEELVSRESIEKVTSLLKQVCGTTLPWLSELSFDERDVDFKAKIAKWDAERPPERAP